MLTVMAPFKLHKKEKKLKKKLKLGKCNIRAEC
jgi:hypothetical protein